MISKNILITVLNWTVINDFLKGNNFDKITCLNRKEDFLINTVFRTIIKNNLDLEKNTVIILISIEIWETLRNLFFDQTKETIVTEIERVYILVIRNLIGFIISMIFWVENKPN